MTNEQIEAAAKTLSACMDYPWEHMPEQGRNNMRKHAKAVIEAAGLATYAGAAAAEPIYQISGAFADDPKCTWRDASKSDYDMHIASKRRILYAAALTSAPAVPEAEETVTDIAKRLYAEHPFYRGDKPVDWYKAPKAVRREWLDKAKGVQPSERGKDR